MLDEIKVLQLGTEDWSRKYELPACLLFSFEVWEEEPPKKPYDLVFVDRGLEDEEVAYLQQATKAHALFVTEDVPMTEAMQEFFENRLGKRLKRAEMGTFLANEARNFYPEHYGEKFFFRNFGIAQGFSGSVTWNGNYSVRLDGDFGEALHQVAFWRNNIPVFQNQAIDFWLEYQSRGDVEIALSIVQFVQGSVDRVQQEWNFSEEELKSVITIDNALPTGSIFVSLLAKGSGSLEIIALHDRYSRRGWGTFLPGGERYVTSEREEFFCYFDPGDRKPPLNVFFSGWKTKQGFEGYQMMRRMKSPFLLISESRLEGGSFYIGSKEYESALENCIKEHMDRLGFSGEDVLMAGLSMGTFGAMYYGARLRPHALLLGKPLASIGQVAENETLLRPGGFPTSLDVLQFLEKGMDEASARALDERFWKRFDAADFGRTKFVISYMKEDDYDTDAYENLISHLSSSGVQIYGKGIHGRHNDETNAIVAWFSMQFGRILREDFGRGEKA